MTWDGKNLGYSGQPPVEISENVYLWRPSDASFWKPKGPFVINQNLEISPPP
jgi:hypothetical protein